MVLRQLHQLHRSLLLVAPLHVRALAPPQLPSPPPPPLLLQDAALLLLPLLWQVLQILVSLLPWGVTPLSSLSASWQGLGVHHPGKKQ